MNKKAKIIIIVLVAYLAVCAFFYWFNRSFYNPGDPDQEKFIQFIDPLGSYIRQRKAEKSFIDINS